MSETLVPGRRSILRAGAALGAVSALATVTGASARADTAPRKPVLVGANPGIQLFDASGACTAYASVWRVDWSTHGAGRALVVWTPDGVSIASTEGDLAGWLWDEYTSHFPELDGLPKPAPTHLHQHVDIDLDLASGLVARSGAITVRMQGVLDRRWGDVADFPLGDRSESLNLVVAPCDSGSIAIAGRALSGALQRGGTPERPWTSAFLSEAEVWRA